MKVLGLALLGYVSCSEEVIRLNLESPDIKLKTTDVEGDFHWERPPKHIAWGNFPDIEGTKVDEDGHHHHDNAHTPHYHHRNRKTGLYKTWGHHKHVVEPGVTNPCQVSAPGIPGNCDGVCNDKGMCIEKTCRENSRQGCNMGRCDGRGRCEIDTCVKKHWWSHRHQSPLQLIGTCEGECVRNRHGGKDERLIFSGHAITVHSDIKRATWCRYDFARMSGDPDAVCNNANCPGECFVDVVGEPEVCSVNTCTDANCPEGHCVNGFCIRNTCNMKNCHHGVCRKSGICVTNFYTDFNHQHGNSFDPTTQ